jgi:hypothetical protein
MRSNVLSPLLVTFLGDGDKRVRKSAFTHLGGFMNSMRFTPSDSDLEYNLTQYYLYMTDRNVAELSNDPHEV